MSASKSNRLTLDAAAGSNTAVGCDVADAREARDWRPTADWAALRLRADVLRRLRAFFDARGFLEVETPLLSAETVVDRHLDPIAAIVAADPRRPDLGRAMYLQTSPELAMKRLLAADDQADAPRAIYQICKAFRNAETGPRHNPEFTLAEWYRLGDDDRAGMNLLAELAVDLFSGAALFDEPGASGSAPAMQVERLAYEDAFQQAVGVDPYAAMIAELDAAAARHDVPLPASLAADDRDGRLDVLFCELVQPRLGRSCPTILHDFPASQAALAQVHQRPGRPPVAARFELFVRGVELANGYHELLDAEVLVARIEANNRARIADGKSPLPAPERLLAAMRHGLPAASGVALGIDRAVMLLAGRSEIAEVCAFPVDRA